MQESTIVSPRSHEEVTEPPSPEAVISLSTTFHQQSALLPIPPDTTFISSDGVLFYAHRIQLLSMSTNRFNGCLPILDAATQLAASTEAKLVAPPTRTPAIRLPHSADVVNIILHVAYSLSCAHYRPNLETLLAAVNTMKLYGLPPTRFVRPSSVLYTLILAQAPIKPILVYATAAAHSLHDLAVAVSSYLLSYPLESLPDVLVVRMGPMYFTRLYILQVDRLRELKRILRPAPRLHPVTDACTFENQKYLSRAWDLAAASIAWDARAGITTSALERVLCPMEHYLGCASCKEALSARIRELVVQWSMVKVCMNSSTNRERQIGGTSYFL
ncbi:hypothetical protein DICSQDRAFT_65164 [Dichomitus squalens LYAD-421 SS1]|uniref:Uncharacterized protein n=2 Tax=Dichomitus squalens TaxID=114155 RepID=R7STD3_DICSQ|nr:uncharacterized protein DICSQDRAFT_65164 [Dichomitus squalens LYAD-421 SS1]EJF59326.1 hypothetical protein DICSQDRAFT_65164 [Dichomitus squalens LYAD-421 SS1]